MIESTSPSQISYNDIIPQVHGSRNFQSGVTGYESSTVPPLKGTDFEKRLTYAIFFWLGVGNLLPWNAFVTAQPYYKSRFCDSVFNNSFENFFSIFFTVSQPIGLILLIRYNKALTINQQVLLTLAAYAILFLLTAALVLVPNVASTELFAITLASTFCCGFCGAIMNGGLFGLAGMLPSSATSALMNGSSLSGLLISLVNFLIILTTSVSKTASSSAGCDTDSSTDESSCSSNYSIDYGALVYFLLSCTILVSCIIFYAILIQLPYIVRHLEDFQSKCDDHNLNNIEGWDFTPSSWRVHSISGGNDAAEVDMLAALIEQNQDRKSLHNDPGERSQLCLTHSLVSVQPSLVIIPETRQQSQRPVSQDNDTTVTTDINHSDMSKTIAIYSSEVFEVFIKIRIPAVSVFLTFAISLTVFPGIISLIQSSTSCSSDVNETYRTLWIPLLFLAWNSFDFLGRVLAERFQSHTIITAENIWLLAVFSALLIPLFLFCNLTSTRLPVAFVSDVFPLFFVVIASLLNGFIANLSMIYGPTLVTPPQAALAGTIMVFCLSSGLLFGSACSFAILYIATGRVL